MEVGGEGKCVIWYGLCSGDGIYLIEYVHAAAMGPRVVQKFELEDRSNFRSRQSSFPLSDHVHMTWQNAESVRRLYPMAWHGSRCSQRHQEQDSNRDQMIECLHG